MTVKAPLHEQFVRPRGGALLEIWALTGRRLKHTMRTPGRLIGIVLNPLVLLVAIGYLFENAIKVPDGGQYINFLVPGVALGVGLASIGPTAIGVRLDLQRGIIDRFRSLPISRGAMLIAHSICDFVIALGALAIVLAVGVALGWRTHSGYLSVALGLCLLAAFIYVMIWIGIALGMVVTAPESIDSIGALVVVLASFLSSAILPPAGYPEWLRPVVAWNPVSLVADAVRGLLGAPVPSTGSFQADNALVLAALAGALLLFAAVSVAQRRFRAI